MGLFLFVDGPALVCGLVNFPILWPHTLVQMKLKCPPGGAHAIYVFGRRLHVNQPLKLDFHSRISLITDEIFVDEKCSDKIFCHLKPFGCHLKE